MQRNFQPVVIIGAARSGTNMIRDIITQVPGIGTWPCDEINYIWRHGNKSLPHDAFSATHATGKVQRFINGKFAALARQQNLDIVVEKTCANSLRVGFVDAVLPDAKYLFMIRDGRDVVASAQKRWTASLDIPYILQKARYVPVLDVPYYASRYLWNRVYRVFSQERRLAFWGPRFEGFENAIQSYSLLQVCALQWAKSVESSLQSFRTIDRNRVYTFHYETFVEDPVDELRSILDFLNVPFEADQINSLVSGVSARSVGTHKKAFDAATVDSLLPLLTPVLQETGYVQ